MMDNIHKMYLIQVFPFIFLKVISNDICHWVLLVFLCYLIYVEWDDKTLKCVTYYRISNVRFTAFYIILFHFLQSWNVPMKASSDSISHFQQCQHAIWTQQLCSGPLISLYSIFSLFFFRSSILIVSLCQHYIGRD